MAARLSIEEILLIKIDTEGNDFNIICGSQRLLQEGRVMVVQFEYNWRWVGFGHWLQSVFRFIKSHDYALGLLTQDGVEVHDQWHSELERYNETNYVLIRKDILPLLPHRRVVFTVSNTVKAA